MKSKKEFQAEMRRRKEERKLRHDEQKKTLKGALTAKVESLKAKQEVSKKRATNLCIKLQNVSGMSAKDAKEQRERVLKMREEEHDKMKLIGEQKATLQNRRKLAWQEQLMKNGKIEALKNKREKAIEAREKEWVKVKNAVAVNRSNFTSRLDAVVSQSKRQYAHLHPWEDEYYVGYKGEEKKSDSGVGSEERQDSALKTALQGIKEAKNSAFTFDVSIDVGLDSPIRAAALARAPTPVSPKDFFRGFPTVSVPTDVFATPMADAGSESDSDVTLKRPNTSAARGPGRGGPLASSPSPCGSRLDPSSTPVASERAPDSGFLFSPLSPSMTRGYSFAFAPAAPLQAVPTDEQVERMSPLQRTYTELRVRKGEDPGVRRMREMIENATG